MGEEMRMGMIGWRNGQGQAKGDRMGFGVEGGLLLTHDFA